MSDPVIRPAYRSWPRYQQALVDVVRGLTGSQLATQPTPDRRPLWATVGHLACQRVSWLCGFLEEPGAERTPFPDALHVCPGDEDLEHVLSAGQLVDALGATFGIVDRVLDTWTLGMLDGVVRRTLGAEDRIRTRGSVIQRVFAHDVYHIAEVNESLARLGAPLIDLWD